MQLTTATITGLQTIQTNLSKKGIEYSIEKIIKSLLTINYKRFGVCRLKKNIEKKEVQIDTTQFNEKLKDYKFLRYFEVELLQVQIYLKILKINKDVN